VFEALIEARDIKGYSVHFPGKWEKLFTQRVIIRNWEKKIIYEIKKKLFTKLKKIVVLDYRCIFQNPSWNRPKSKSRSGTLFSFYHGANGPIGPSHYRRFTISLRPTALGRTPLDEWSSRRRDLYLTTHSTHDRHPCHQHDSNPQSPRKRVAADPRLRPRDHRDRHTLY
jgi:hypothetical protein